MEDKTRTAYVCGPLTELDPSIQPAVKGLYSRIADRVEEITGVRAFVPHEHYDPVTEAGFTPQEVYAAESAQILKQTSALLVFAIEPTWGGGVEVGLCNLAKEHCLADIPVVIFAPQVKLGAVPCGISRMLRGGPAVRGVVPYGDPESDPLDLVAQQLMQLGLSKRPDGATPILRWGGVFSPGGELNIETGDGSFPIVRFTSLTGGYDGIVHFAGAGRRSLDGQPPVDVAGMICREGKQDDPRNWICSI